MSASNNNNINIPKICKNCPNNKTEIISYFNERLKIFRCKHVGRNAHLISSYKIMDGDYIKNCPCGNCVVKAMCKKLCEKITKKMVG